MCGSGRRIAFTGCVVREEWAFLGVMAAVSFVWAVYRRRHLIEGRVLRDLGRRLTIKDHETAVLFYPGGLLPLALWMTRLCFRSGKFCDAPQPERDSEEGREEWPLRASLDPSVEIWKFGAFGESFLRLEIWNSPYSESLNGHYPTVVFIYLFIIFCIYLFIG